MVEVTNGAEIVLYVNNGNAEFVKQLLLKRISSPGGIVVLGGGVSLY